jgi:hypothetical protein
MAKSTATVEGTIDSTPLSPAVKSKVQTALKSSLESELTVVGIVPSHHASITHFSITWDQV